MADGKTKGAAGERGRYKLELVGLKAGGERPGVVVEVRDRKDAVIHAQEVGADGVFTIPPEALERAQRVVVGAADDKGGVEAEGALSYRAAEFAAQIQNGTLALAEAVWSRLLLRWMCVSGRVRLCRRRPWWFDNLVAAATLPLASSSARLGLATRESVALAFDSPVKASLDDLLRWPYRCYPVCLGTVEVYRRTCCCWPILVDDLRIADLIRELERVVVRLPKPKPRRFPPPPPPPVDPLATPFFAGGGLNELALRAAHDLSVLRRATSEQAAQYVNAREYLLHRLCRCSRPVKVATGTLQPDGTFNICWREPWRFLRLNCHEQYAYRVKQTIGGTTTTIYDGVAAGAWYSPGDDPTLTSYHSGAFTCPETGTAGDAYVFLDLVGDTESHELTTPDATGWDRVDAPGATSGLLFPNAGPFGHLRNLGGALELTFTFSLGMRDPAVGAHYYRLSICRADEFGNPTGDRYYYGKPIGPNADALVWQKVSGLDIVPETLGPSNVPAPGGGVEKYLYRIPYTDEAWVGSVRYHALVYTLNSDLDEPAAADIASPASNHLVTLEVFNAAGERLRPLGTAASGQPGTEVAKPFKFRRWFQPGGSVGNDTVEVPFAALTHLFCWDNRRPEADITRLVKDAVPSGEECQFLVGDDDATFGLEYRAYVPDERFQHLHGISWVRGLNGSLANGGVGTLPTPLSPANVGKPLAPPANSGTNTFQQMLTRINPDLSTVVLKRCSFAVTLITYSKTTDGEDFDYPWDHETAAFALEIGHHGPP